MTLSYFMLGLPTFPFSFSFISPISKALKGSLKLSLISLILSVIEWLYCWASSPQIKPSTATEKIYFHFSSVWNNFLLWVYSPPLEHDLRSILLEINKAWFNINCKFWLGKKKGKNQQNTTVTTTTKTKKRTKKPHTDKKTPKKLSNCSPFKQENSIIARFIMLLWLGWFSLSMLLKGRS